MMQLLKEKMSSADEVAELSEARLHASARMARRALKAFGGDEDQEALIATLLGEKGALSLPLSSSLPLRRLARVRTTATLRQILGTGNRNCRLVTVDDAYEPVPYDACAIDFKKRRAIVAPLLRAEARNVFATFQLLTLPKGVAYRTLAILWDDGPTTQAATKRFSKHSQPTTVKTINTASAELDAAVATIWDGCCSPNVQLVRKRKTWKAPKDKSHDAYELRGLLLRFFVSLGRSGFGFGEGKAAWRSVSRELAARAQSLDVLERNRGLQSRLPELITQVAVSGDMNNFKLPAITNL